jgi:hypothetical protein
MAHPANDSEAGRLAEDSRREGNWKRWGPYLSERQWGTVREDYSAPADPWGSFPHEHARSRAYRWGEDGLLGICDREARLCFALALWNEKDFILKERLFGLTGPQGNHGEDVKECYFYLDSTPTHSYFKGLYKYPQAVYPYGALVEENRRRNRRDPEYELVDTGIFDRKQYFDVLAEYAKASPDDLLIRITVYNRSSERVPLHVLPTLWFRNSWSWGRSGEGYWPKPRIHRSGAASLTAEHSSLGRFQLSLERLGGQEPELLFTENETNFERLFGVPNPTPYVKDAFHAYVVEGRKQAVNPEGVGTKAAAHYEFSVPAQGEVVLRLRLFSERERSTAEFGTYFDALFTERIREADGFFAAHLSPGLTEEERGVCRQAYAGLLWSKQFYHLDVKAWLEGDPSQVPAPESRKRTRYSEWQHLYNRDVISMPDKWEYPWYGAWDLAFHMLPFARIDPDFAKEQLILLLREWYMHPNGQLPAYEFAFWDVNPPVHAWAAWRVYKIASGRGARDRQFLARVFHKLLLNFTWWVNRKDPEGNNLFSGGFLGLDNVGVFNRSESLPAGGFLKQADGTAWMAFFCDSMLSIALELARHEPLYDDLASKFFEHFVQIADAMNRFGGSGLWDEEDGFYYDHLEVNGHSTPLRLRSMVGLVPLFAVEILDEEVIDRLPQFKKRMRWFLENRKDLARTVAFEQSSRQHHGRYLLAIPSRSRLERVLKYLLDENEFLSPYGIRSLSRVYQQRPYSARLGGMDWVVEYAPGESTSALFGGNSNWRGPIWFPMNYLLVEALERYHHFYGEDFRVECPTGSGQFRTLREVAREIASRLSRLFLSDSRGRRPWEGESPRFGDDPYWRNLVLFHEAFDGDNGRGLGASHQTGWTSLIIRFLEDVGRMRRS